MRARRQLLTAISNRRKAIGEGADEAVKKLNDAVGEANRSERADIMPGGARYRASGPYEDVKKGK